MNQLNERQGDVPVIDYQFLENLDPRICIRKDTRQLLDWKISEWDCPALAKSYAAL